MVDSKRPTAVVEIEEELARLASLGLRRDISSAQFEGTVFCSNDYLGLARSPAAPTDSPSGAAASPLVCGYTGVHADASEQLRRWLAVEQVLLFSSAYATNLGVIQALGGPDTLIVSDALNHASIVDGCRLSRSSIEVVPHLSIEAIDGALTASRHRRKWVVTEAYFSMDGDSPNLPALRACCDRHGAGLIVDEAHSLGLFGPQGRGLCAQSQIVPDVLIGALGKAFGLSGGFVATTEVLASWFWNKARSFVFSTAPSPLLISQIPTHLETIQAADPLRARALLLANQVRAVLPNPPGFGPIIPWVLGSASRAISASTALREAGLLVQPIRPPTVPDGASRLRITVSAAHTDVEVAHLVQTLASLVPRFT